MRGMSPLLGLAGSLLAEWGLLAPGGGDGGGRGGGQGAGPPEAGGERGSGWESGVWIGPHLDDPPTETWARAAEPGLARLRMRGPHAACTLEPREADCRFPLASGGKASIGPGGLEESCGGDSGITSERSGLAFPGPPKSEALSRSEVGGGLARPPGVTESSGVTLPWVRHFALGP